jgi:hypothetical protein
MAAWVADARHSRIGDEGDPFACLQFGDKFDGPVAFVVLVQANGRHCDFEVVEELLGLAGVFAGDPVGGFEDAQGAEGDVFEVADGGGYQVEAGGQVAREFGVLIGVRHWEQDSASCLATGPEAEETVSRTRRRDGYLIFPCVAHIPGCAEGLTPVAR